MWIRALTPMRFWLFFSLVTVAFPVQAGTIRPLTPELEKYQAEGFSLLYNLRHAEAKKQFETMIQKESRHPAGYVYLASAIWLEELTQLRRIQTQIYNKGNAFFRQKENKPVNASVNKAFYSTIEKGILRAKLRLKKDPKDPAGLYFLGTAHGAIAGYESTIKRSFFSSLQNGSKAVHAHRKLIKLYPDFADAYVSVGMYNYVVGTLPAGAKILMLLGGIRGSKDEGLKQLTKAADHGIFAREEAAALLVLLYDREKKHAEALKMIGKLAAKFPENPIFQFELAVMHEKAGQYQHSIRIYDVLLKEDNARKLLLDYIQFQYAEILFFRGSWGKALERYLAARRVRSDTPVGLITMSHLRSGQCLNAMGRHNQAKLEYEFVLKQPDIYQSHKLARKYLNLPFHGPFAAALKTTESQRHGAAKPQQNL